MCHLKLKSELNLFGLRYSVVKISKKTVLFALAERKDNAAQEIELSLRETEEIVFTNK